MTRTFFVALLSILFAASAWAGEVTVSGATAVANTIVIPHQAEIEKMAGVKINITPNSSEAGLEALFKGNTQIAMISSSMDDLMKKMADEIKANNIKESNLFEHGLGKVEGEHLGVVVQGVPTGDIKNVMDAIAKFHQ